MSTPPFLHGSYRDLSSALAAELAAARAHGTIDEWVRNPIEILVPSAGVASQLQRDLLETLASGTTGIVLRTIESFATDIVRRKTPAVRIASMTERTLAMIAATRVVNGSTDLFFESRGLVTMLERSWRDIADSNRLLSDLQRNVRRHPNPERFAAIVEIWQEYERILASTGAVEPGAVLREAAALIAGGVPAVPQIIFGFYDATGLQLSLFAALFKRGLVRSIHLPFRIDRSGEGEPFRFARRFLLELPPLEPQLVSGWRASSPPGEAGGLPPLAEPPHRVTRHRSREAELRATCRSVATLLAAGVLARDIGVVRRSLDARDLSLLRRQAREFGFAFAVAPEKELRSHRFGRGIALLLNLREKGFPRADVLEAAASGLSPQSLGFTPRLTVLDDVSRKAAIVAGGSTDLRPVVQRTADGYRKEALEEYLRLLDRIEALAPPLERDRTAETWGKLLRQLVNLFESRSVEDVDVITAVENLSREIEHLGERRFGTGEIVDILLALTVTGQRSPDAVWLGDVMKLRGRSFRHLFVLSLEDDVFPQQRSDDPVLPDSARSHFSVRTIGEGEDEEAMLFALTLGAATRELVLSFAAADVGGKVRRPSRLLVDYLRQRHPSDHRIVSDFASFVAATFPPKDEIGAPFERAATALLEGAENLTPSTERRLVQASRSATSSFFDGYLTLDSEIVAYLRERLAKSSPSRFEDFGECPQKYFLKAVLRLEEVEDPEHEVEMELRKKGLLQHAVLEDFYRKLPPEKIAVAVSGVPPRLAPDVRELLESCIEAAFAGYDIEHPPVNRVVRKLELKRLRRLLVRFVTHDLLLLAREGFVPKYFEMAFGTASSEEESPPVELHFAGEEISVRGKIDRIDVNEEGTHRIIDYKSGVAYSRRDLDKKVDAGHALQLPLYALALKEIFGLDSEQLEARIRPIGKPGDVKPFSIRLEEKEERLLETLSLFVAGIAKGQFPPLPGNYCDYCVVANYCRTRHDDEERVPLREFKQARDLFEARKS